MNVTARAPGRPEKSPARLKTATLTRQEDGLGREVRGTAPGVPSRNGMPEGGGYVYRGTGEDTGVTARLGAARLRHEAEQAVGPVAPPLPVPARPRRKPAERAAVRLAPEPAAGEAAPKPRKRAVLTTACPGCGRLKPDKYVTCAGAGPCLAPGQAPEREPEPVPEPASVPAKRHRKCGYPFGSVGHKAVCGGAP